MKMRLVQDFAALPDLGADWERIRAQASWPTLFCSHEWVTLWLRYWGGARQPYFIVGEDAGRVAGIMPLLSGGGSWRKLPARTLTFCTNNHSVRGGLVVSDSKAEAFARASMEFLARRRDWDMMVLDGLDAAAPAHRVLGGLAQEVGLGFDLRGTWGHCFAVAAESRAAYMAPLATLRRSLKRSQTALSEMGKVEYTVAREAADVLARIPEFLAIDAASWKRAGGETMTSSGPTQEFYTALFRAFARSGKARLIIMYVGGEAVCGVFCIHDNGVLYGLKTSFRETLADGRPLATSKTSPGLHIYQEMIGEMCRPGTQGLDFVARYPALQRFTPEVRAFHAVSLRANAIYPRLLTAVDRGIRGLRIDKGLRALRVAR